jgi:hypothetical protein
LHQALNTEAQFTISGMSAPQSQNDVKAIITEPAAKLADVPNEVKSISPEQLLNALDTQIKFEADSQRNEGWTRWAIWGAIAALVWIATDLWRQPSLEFSRMVSVWLLIFVLWKFLEELIWVISPYTRMEIGPTRFRPSADTIHPLRPAMMVTTMQYLLILCVLGYFRHWNQWFLCAYACVGFVGSALMLCLGTFIIGFPEKVSTKAIINSVTFLQLSCLGVAGWRISKVIYSSLGSFSLADVRLALVLIAFVFLVSRLAMSTPSEILLSKLTQLRQHLAFGRISLSDAYVRSEELLGGVTLDKLFSHLVRPILDEEAKLQARLAEAKQVLDKANEEMTAPDKRPQEAIRLLDSMGNPPTMVAQQLKQNRRAWNRFAGQAIGFAIYSQESKSEIKAIEDQVRASLADVNQKLKACYDRYDSLKNEAFNLAVTSQDDSPLQADKGEATRSNK